MVRWVWQNRIVLAVRRFLRLLVRWLLVWLSYLAGRVGQHLRVSGRVLRWLVRPRDPNNLFVRSREPGHETAEVAPTGGDEIGGADRRPTLLYATEGARAVPEPELATSAASLWSGLRPVTAAEAAPGTAAANHRFSYLDVLATQIKRLTPAEIKELEALIQRLARKWLDLDETFEPVERRNRLDVGRTLRYNIPRYAGRILQFQWGTKQRPVAQLGKPARILVIGDVSHSMVHYVSVILYFMHSLNFRFLVDSYVFSDRATHSTPYLKGEGTFEEKVRRLIAGARSWSAGTRFGTALAEIAESATIDQYTYVIIATDGKVSLHGSEPAQIETYMKELRRRARQVIFVTPSADFSDGTRGKSQPERLGSFKYDFFDIPIYAVGPPLWYGTLGEYAHRLYLVRTVQDLIDMTEDLILSSRGE